MCVYTRRTIVLLVFSVYSHCRAHSVERSVIQKVAFWTTKKDVHVFFWTPFSYHFATWEVALFTYKPINSLV